LKGLSEGEFIARMCERVSVPVSPEGPGDDAAVSGGQVTTVDLMVEGVHFSRAHPPLWLGAKLLAVNISDVGAMAAKPTQFVLTAALPEDAPAVWWDALSEGVGHLARQVGATLVGGDVTRSPGPVMLGVTAWGELGGRRPLLRSGGRPGDVLMVHAPQGIGRSCRGLSEWRAAKLEGWGVEPPERASECVQAHLNPQTSWRMGPWASDHGATAGMDCSDGLVADLPRLSAASQVRLDVELAGLPIDLCCGEMSVVERAAGGEDYGLLVLIPPSAREVFEGAGFIALGAARQGQGVSWSLEGALVHAIRPSFDHFPAS
jgi:thiamine-monophosphate kinase